MSDLLTIGTRGSQLALAQAHQVRAMLLAAHPGLRVELRVITTKGDLILDRPLAAIGDKGLFVKEIEAALLAGEVDLAVHSAKDLPSQLPPELTLAAFPERADPRDALLVRADLPARDLAALPAGAVVGTSSLRRACQLLAARPDLVIETLRGNVDTRLRRLAEGRYAAIVLAMAGLLRLGLADRVTQPLAPEVMLPAVAQGALALQCRADDPRALAALAALDHPATRVTVLAERAMLRRLEGGCQVPIGGFAMLADTQLTLRGVLGRPDGSQVARASRRGPASDPLALGVAVAEDLLAQAAAPHS